MATPRNETLTVFSFLATINLLFAHMDDLVASRPLPVAILGTTFSDAALFSFCALSAYFLGRHVGEKGWLRAALAKRVPTLLVPYVLWCVISAAAHCLMGWHLPPGFRGLNHLFGLSLGQTPECFQMWYIKSLYLFMFASPLFVWPLLKFRSFAARVALMAAAVAAYFCAKHFGLTAMKPFAHGGFELLAFLFFCGGLWLSQVKPSTAWIAAAASRRPVLLGVGALGAWLASSVWAYHHPACFEFNVLVGAISLLLIASAVKRLPSVLTRNMFFVFGSHIMLRDWLWKYLDFGNPLATYLLAIVVVLALGIVLGELLRRFVPSLYAPLVGGRV